MIISFAPPPTPVPRAKDAEVSLRPRANSENGSAPLSSHKADANPAVSSWLCSSVSSTNGCFSLTLIMFLARRSGLAKAKTSTTVPPPFCLPFNPVCVLQTVVISHGPANLFNCFFATRTQVFALKLSMMRHFPLKEISYLSETPVDDLLDCPVDSIAGANGLSF